MTLPEWSLPAAVVAQRRAAPIPGEEKLIHAFSQIHIKDAADFPSLLLSGRFSEFMGFFEHVIFMRTGSCLRVGVLVADTSAFLLSCWSGIQIWNISVIVNCVTMFVERKYS